MSLENKKRPVIDSFRGNYFFLSNFYPVKIVIDCIEYPSSEHAYQAQKTLDTVEMKRIAIAPTAKDSKRLGRLLKIRDDWDAVKIDVMRMVVMAKFSQNNDLKKNLLGTEGKELIEANSWGDKFWGTCEGDGKNWLGKILMETREKLQET
jgi:ribA/ribD-fused uncharacterized protein